MTPIGNLFGMSRSAGDGGPYRGTVVNLKGRALACDGQQRAAGNSREAVGLWPFGRLRAGGRSLEASNITKIITRVV